MKSTKQGLRAVLAALMAAHLGLAAAQGVPQEQWNANERTMVEMTRAQYKAQGMELSQEQAEMTVKAMRDQIARMMGAAAGVQMAASQMQMQRSAPMMQMQAPTSAAAPAAATASTTEAQLAQAIRAWPPKPTPFAVNQRRDGFDINGSAVLDPDGRIFSYAVNPVSGAGTYALQGRNGVVIKAFSPAPPHQSLTIATAVQESKGWVVTTATGQSVFGETMSVLSDGFLVGRGSSAFRYRTGGGLQSVSVPAGYFLTPMQRGDVGATGFVLLEKESEVKSGQGNQLTDMMSALQAVGSALGATRKEDYALLNMQNGQLIPLNIPLEGKTIAIHSECRRVNWAVSKCKQMQSFESLFDTMGMKNNSHYFWKVQWLPTAQGPIALTQEEGVSNIYATNLQTGQKVRLFNRALGIGDWDVNPGSDGRIGVRARLVFDWHDIPDVVAFMQSPQAAESAAAEAAAPPASTGLSTQ
ncbi:hypothetical protein ACFIQF_16680 [Comamonas sp. J-3]|uniref:hypothetical protein n=1 Tax=Comamonas trifloxystrobinivorans TaxID=3350256 RepID=UPI00372C1193